MDVRCEKCHTEYELEESKVTEAGVTVKCTSCGNLFKIKRRGPTSPPVKPPELPADAGAMWLIRSPGGEHRRFRELTTLQQWIVERKVTRECEISRSGETWKRLGEIAELSAFFAIVDQAQGSRPNAAQTAAAQAAVIKATQPFAPPSVLPARATIPGPPLPPPALPVDATAATMAASPALLDRSPEFAQTAHIKPRPEDRPTRASWQGAALKAPEAEGFEDVKTDEPAWTANNRTVKVQPDSLGDFSDLDYIPKRQSRAWMFVTAAVIAVGGVGVWLITRAPATPVAAAPSASPTEPAATAPPAPAPAPTVAPIAAPPDAAPAAAAPPNEAALKEGLARLAEDTDASFTAAEKALEGARVADPVADARAAAALALVASARAQYLTDDAALAADPRVAAEAKAESARQLVRAEKLAREAESKDPRSLEAAVAMADVLRQQKRPAADVEKRLALAGEGAEAQYVRGMLLLRDGKAADAEAAFVRAIDARVKEGATHLRARYRLASMAVAAGKTDAAREQLAGILEVQPQHARAKALAAKLAAPPVAAATPPPAPSSPGPAPPLPGASSPGPAPGAELGSGPIASREYGGLVGRGDKLAENGDCKQAMRYYERALDARPGGVEALTGLGYCYLDQKAYGRAISSFRAALGISSRYTEALIGIAEAYRFQGQTAEAATYYRRYLEQAPNGPKAAMARRYVDEQGGGDKPAQPTAPPPSEPRPAEPTPAAPPPTAPPIDQLPDKPGGAPAAQPPAENKLPDKAEPAPEPAPEPPPPARPTDPAAPDSPQR